MSGGGSNKVNETPEQRALAEVASARVADYKRRWAPTEDYFMSKAADRDRLKGAAIGQSAAETRGQFSAQEGKVESALTNQGAKAGSGRFVSGVSGLGMDEATSGGLGRSAANLAAETEYVKGLQDIVAMGQGQSGEAIEGLGTVANLSGKIAAEDAQTSAMGRSAIGEVIGVGAGYGLTAKRGGLNPTTPAAPTGH